MQAKTNPLPGNRLASQLTQASPAAIILADSLGIIEALNEVGLRWFGYEEMDLIGQPIEILFPVENQNRKATSDEPSHRACFPSRLSDSEPGRSWSMSGRRQDGSMFPLKLTWHRLLTGNGEARLAHVVDVGRNEKHIEGERLAAVLQMVSGLAHKSRNSLQRAQSCLDLLKLDLENQSELKKLGDTIGQALQDIQHNYEMVKNYAAPITLKRTPVNLAQLCLSTFNERIETPGTDARMLKLHCNAVCESVSLDANRIGEVFRHVLQNAIQASWSSSVIEFHCGCPSSEKPSSIQVSIRDHGTGLTAEVEAQMFEPFFTTKLQGTGLSLAVCRRIIEAHDGTIEASNHADGGTVVKINLPM